MQSLPGAESTCELFGLIDRCAMMTEISQYLPGIIAAYTILLVGCFSPGPSVTLLIGIATAEGRSPALLATLGIAAGSMTVNLLTMSGVGLVLSHAVWAMSLLRIIGAAYLLFLAYGAFARAIHPPSLPLMGSDKPKSSNRFLTGYLLQVTNPKAIAFWLAISSIGAVEGGGPGVVLLFVVGAFCISFTCHGVWAVVLSIVAVREAYLKGRRWIELALGCFFVIFAYKLITTDS